MYHSLGNFDYKVYPRHQHMDDDKSGRTLAWLMKADTSHMVIGAVRNGSGLVVNSQEAINGVFLQYYMGLY